MRFECIDSGIIVYTWNMKILGENWTHGLWKDNMRIYKFKCNTLKMTSEICVTMMMNKVLIFFKLVFNRAEKFCDIFFKRYEVAYSEL